ncbi:MAG: ferric reductase-like transmembrane domain-containing protein, partial [Pseudohongiellaceae bacterium]
MGNSVSTCRRLVWLLALLPGLMALPFLEPANIATASAWFNTLGRLTGIWGLSFLLVAAALCCRVPGFDRPFGGLTKLWQIHHQLGAVAFLLLLAHPLLLAFAATGIALEAAMSTLFSTRVPVLWGWVALLALMVFMAPSFGFFGEPEYQRWKILHRLSGVAVVFALVHSLMLARTWPEWLSITVWAALASLTLMALAYRWGYARWHGRRAYRVAEVVHPARDVVELTLRPEGEPLRYRAGQFVYLTPWSPGVPGHREEHPYTLSSAPKEPGLRLAVKDLGDASRALQRIALDSCVWVEGPYGHFFQEQTSAPELWIAGGIGITPFLGRIRDAISEGKA